MADYRLYCAGVSGNAYKAALMLNLSGCDWEPVVLDYIGGATRQEGFREEINELGEIPVLEHGAKRLSQSGAILTYLAEKTGRFGGRDEDEKLEILRWILFDNHKFTSYFATLRFLVGIQKTGETPVTEFLRGRTQTAFGMVEKHLAGRDFLLGDRPTIADISMVGYLYYTEETGLDRAPYPNITGWAKRIAALPGWAPPYDLMR
ncbi:MAG TPA: glutathione S-transferase family protein [Verrucomicrobiae bacterium]|jgi:glutathione S-transferase|nr:glutathione S-transferase family protein [Verrucomicrobiae bacterium]